MDTERERLYRIARDNARNRFGTGWSLLGPEIQRAMTLAEVVGVIGAQDDESNPMTAFATYAIVRVIADTK